MHISNLAMCPSGHVRVQHCSQEQTRAQRYHGQAERDGDHVSVGNVDKRLGRAHGHSRMREGKHQLWLLIDFSNLFRGLYLEQQTRFSRAIPAH